MKLPTGGGESGETTSSSSSAGEMVGSIDDLLIELFLRIPLKPLVQLKLVSKHWNALIKQLRDDNKPVGFIFHTRDPGFDKGKETAYILSLDRSLPVGPPSTTRFSKDYLMINKIFHSCNGLLVGYLRGYYDWGGRLRGFQRNNYFVYNPTTCEKISIPVPRRSGSVRWMYLAFDPSNSPHYKIVCFLSTRKFAVYSSKTRSWKKYDNRFGYEFEFEPEKGVYWNGSIHWISLYDHSIYFSPPDHDDDDDENVVDGADYESDDDGDSGNHLTVLEMPTPPILEDESTSNNYFGESGDHLNFISYYGKDEYKFKVYEMRRDYSEWFVRYSVDVSNVWSRVWNKRLQSFGCPRSFAVCGLVRGKKGDDDDDDSFLVLLIKNRMVVYNVATGTFEITSEFREEEFDEEEDGVGYDVFYAIRSYFKRVQVHCPLQHIVSLSLV